MITTLPTEISNQKISYSEPSIGKQPSSDIVIADLGIAKLFEFSVEPLKTLAGIYRYVAPGVLIRGTASPLISGQKELARQTSEGIIFRSILGERYRQSKRLHPRPPKSRPRPLSHSRASSRTSKANDLYLANRARPFRPARNP